MQKNIRIFIIGAVLVSVSLFGAYWVQRYLQGSKAAAAPPTISFAVYGPKVNPGDAFDLTLQVNPNLTPFYTFNIAFTYDPTKVSLATTDPAKILSNITPLSTKTDGTLDVQLLNGPGSTNIDTASHTVRIVGLRVNGTNDPFIGRDTLSIAKVSFVMNTNQVLPLDFKWIDPDPAKINISDSFEKKDLSYTGLEPTGAPLTVGYSCGGDSFSGVPSNGNFTDSFTGTALNSANWNPWSNGSGTSSIANNKATFQLPASATQTVTTVDLDGGPKQFIGDFTAEITSTSISNGNSGAAYLGYLTNNNEKTSGFDIKRNSMGYINTYVFINQTPDIRKDITFPTPLSNTDPIKFKIEKKGFVINMYYDLLKGQGYQLAQSINNFPTAQGRIVFGAQTWAPNYPAVTAVFSDYKFTQGPSLDLSKWAAPWTDNGGAVSVGGGDLLISNPAGTKDNSTVVSPKQTVTGDFSAEVTLKDHSTANNKLTSNLAFNFAATDQSRRINFQKAYNKGPGELVAYWWDGKDNSIGKNDSIDHNTPVTVKIQRVGTTMTLSYKKTGQNYILLKQLDNYYSGPGTISLSLFVGGLDYPQSSGSFDDFKLTCFKPGDSVGPIGAGGSTPIPSTSAPTPAYNPLTPIPPIMGQAGKEGTSTPIRENTDLLYINSIATYASPFRYEQAVTLHKGTYSLLVGAKIYVRKGRGVAMVVVCNEATCGAKKKDQLMYVSPIFPVKADFSEMAGSFTIPDDADNKQYIFRIFCEDGSECELDYISLEDAWGSQMLKNNHFGVAKQYTDAREEPTGWTEDATADFYGSVNNNYGYKGALMINNSAK